MRIGPISSPSQSYHKNIERKRLSKSEIDKINQASALIIKSLYDRDAKNKQQNQQKNKKQFVSHDSLFYISEIPEEMSVSYIYSNTNEVLIKLEELMFDTDIGKSLLQYYLLLKNENNIKIGFESRKSNGYFRPSERNIKESKIFLQGNRTLISMAGTLIHELTHLMDINNIMHSAKLNYITTADLEIKAFANKYIFFVQGSYLSNIEFKGLSQTAKSLLCESSKYLNNINSRKYLYSLLSDVGYSYSYLNRLAI
ncbi:MAG: hypothetical protein DRG78_00970 [Epsilonproteobacteria bacterium]|nr:MAG: hypothetical protein DRG78_00970 [Campylobacterota bacterium]